VRADSKPPTDQVCLGGLPGLRERRCPTWKMVLTDTAKYVQTINTANGPLAAQINTLTNRLNSLATCTGASCVQ
jgi:hypothetical protein